MTARRAAIYARQSLDRSGEGLAVDRQLADCRELCARHEWSIVGEHVDNDVSATSGRERPAYRRLIESVRAGGVDTIVAWAPDRLARRPRDLEDVLDLAEHNGLSLATVSGDVDLSTPYGKAVARIFGAIARQESEQKGARQKRANLQQAQSGHARWTRRPFGFDRDDDGRVVVVEHEAAELKTAAAAVLGGASIGSVAARWNTDAVPTSLGGRWTTRSVRAALLNPKLAGRVVYRGQVVAEGTWPAVLDTATHDRLTARLTDPARRTQTSTRPRYLLSGLARCGRCGGRLFHSPAGTSSRAWSIYRCKPSNHLSRRQDLVDAVVERVVLARLARPDAASLFTADDDRAEHLLARAVELRDRLDELADLLADGTLTAAGVRRSSERVRTELAAVEGERAQLATVPEVAALAAAEDVAAVWTDLPLPARRAVVDALMTVTVEQVSKGARFAPEQVRIDWKVNQ